MRYSLVQEMREKFDELERELAIFCQHLADLRLLIGRTFTLPPPLKSKELSPTPTINVTQHIGETARQQALHHFRHLFMQQQSEEWSTRSALRLPGAICLQTTPAQQQLLTAQVEAINCLKGEFQRLVTVDSELPPNARFPFVHQHFPGLITLNAYRTITLHPVVDSVRFGWANKHVIKRMQRDEVIGILEKSLQAKRARAPWTREQWAERVGEELDLLRGLPATARLKIKRPVKVQPIARLWQAGQQRQTQLACPSPLIFTCLEGQTLPEIGELLDYDENNINYRHKPEAQPATLIIPRLWLWLDHD